MQTITAEELKTRMDQGEKLNLVDVREQDEHDDFNIGGILLPLGKIQNMMVDELEELRGQELILYCRSGNRSGMASLVLDTLGFKNTKNLTGGMMAWQQKFGS